MPHKKSEKPSELEVIFTEPQHSFRWHEHDYPFELARWNHHPQFEIHLIRQGSGRFFTGDYIGHFDAGHLALIGPDLPHDWSIDLAPGERIVGRDVVLQFEGDSLLKMRETLPEVGDLQRLFTQSRQGIEFCGATRRKGVDLLEAIGRNHGLKRLWLFFSLLQTLNDAPPQESRLLASLQYAPMLDSQATERMRHVLDYIQRYLDEELRVSVIAQQLNMSEPSFSRFFKRTTGHTFVDLTRKLRIQRACRLLLQTRLSIAEICFSVGYGNLSNFNRHFRHEMLATPSEYRKRLER